jgi:hypothetical protein
MNFSAFEHWTDGWRVHSLMPNDEGLRRCQCGRFILMKDLVDIGAAESSDLPPIDHVQEAQLSACIEQAGRDEVELAARLGYWRYLNHPYRELYRQHRDAEEAATKAAWESAHPDRRTWWGKLVGQKPPEYRRPSYSPLTYPAFVVTDAQRQNMERLCDVISSWSQQSGSMYTLELAELYRERGLFGEAEQVIQALEPKDVDVTRQLIMQLIHERQTAPVRYRA